MGRRADAVVAELQRMERKRRILKVIALVIGIGAAVAYFSVHGFWLRGIVVLVAGFILLVVAAESRSVLDPFTMEKATRPKSISAANAKAERQDDEIRDLVEAELASTKLEDSAKGERE